MSSVICSFGEFDPFGPSVVIGLGDTVEAGRSLVSPKNPVAGRHKGGQNESVSLDKYFDIYFDVLCELMHLSQVQRNFFRCKPFEGVGIANCFYRRATSLSASPPTPRPLRRR